MTYQVARFGGLPRDTSPGSILKRPDLAQLIACVCADWAQIEDQLALCYGALLSIGWRTHDVGIAGKINFADLVPAHHVFDSLESIHPRMRIIERLTDVLAPTLLGHWRNSMEPTIRTAAKARNTVAHGRWAVADDHPNALLLMPATMDTHGAVLGFKASDFKVTLEQLAITFQACWDYWGEVEKLVAASRAQGSR